MIRKINAKRLAIRVIVKLPHVALISEISIENFFGRREMAGY